MAYCQVIKWNPQSQLFIQFADKSLSVFPYRYRYVGKNKAKQMCSIYASIFLWALKHIYVQYMLYKQDLWTVNV